MKGNNTTVKTFSNIRFKKKTVQRFQEFSKRFFKTHTEAFFATSLEAIELRKEKNTLKRDLKETKQQFEDILFSKINIVKSSFGKPKIQLDMSLEELEALKERIKNS